MERGERAAREFDGNGHNDHQLIRIRNGQCFSSPSRVAAALTPLADSLVVGQCSVCLWPGQRCSWFDRSSRI